MKKIKTSLALLVLSGAIQAEQITKINSVVIMDRLNLADKVAQMKPKKLSSIVVNVNGKKVHESYYNGTKAEDLHDIRSASKSFTSLMFGVAIKDGHFSSEKDLIATTFPDYGHLISANEAKQKITYFDLLSNTNPVECDDMNQFSQGNEERMYLRKDWLSFFFELPLRANPPWETPMAEQPYGRDFSYCTAGIFTVGAAIERKTQTSLANYTQTALFSPIGIQKSIWQSNAMGQTQGGGGVRIKPTDLIKVGQLLINQGKWQGKQLIQKEWIKKSFTDYSLAMPDLNATYGLTWWILPFQVNGKTIKTFAAAGNGGNYLFVIPSLETTAVITATAYNTRYMHQQTHEILSTIVLPAIVN